MSPITDLQPMTVVNVTEAELEGLEEPAEKSQAELLSSIRRVLYAILLLMLGAALYVGKLVAMPIVLGLLITFTLSPFTRTMSRYHIPAPVSALLVISITFGIIGGGMYALSEPLARTMERVPSIGEKVKERLTSMQSSMDTLSEVSDNVQSMTSDADTNQVVVAQPGILSTAASTVATGLTSFALASLLALFLLSSGNLLDEKLVQSLLLLRDKKRALRMLREIESKVSRYLLTITLINISLGVVIACLLAFYGKSDPVLWGAIAALLNFLPYLGAIIGTGLLALVSLGEYEVIGAALIPPLIYYACSAVEGNLITPLIVGRNLKLNIMAVFLSIVLWSWLWGVAGALMAVPILVIFKVVSEHLDGWKTFDTFLSARDHDT